MSNLDIYIVDTLTDTIFGERVRKKHAQRAQTEAKKKTKNELVRVYNNYNNRIFGKLYKYIRLATVSFTEENYRLD